MRSSIAKPSVIRTSFAALFLSLSVVALAVSTEMVSFGIFGRVGAQAPDPASPVPHQDSGADSARSKDPLPKAQPSANGRFVFALGDLPLSFPQRRDRLYTISDGGPAQELGSINDFEPSWSPDGRKVIFITRRDGSTNDDQNRNIYTMNADGTDQERTGTGPYVGGDAQPSYSYHANPNDQRIVFVADYSGQDQGIYTTDTNGNGTPVRLDTDACFEEEFPEELRRPRSKKRAALTPGIFGFDTPNYSPDNNFIIFGYPNYDNYSTDIYRVNSDGTNCIRLYEGEYDSYVPATARYSRDGTKIALHHRESFYPYAHKLRIINATTGALLQELEPTNFQGSPVWSPNVGESKVAYIGGSNDPDNPIANLEIRTIDLSSEFEEQIVSTGVPEGIRGFDWTATSPFTPSLTLRINQPHPLPAGTSTTATLTRSTPAPAGGVTVPLQAFNPTGPGQSPIVNLPATSVTFLEGETQASFQIDAPYRTDFRSVNVFANSPSPNFGQAEATVSVTPARPDLETVSITAPASTAPGTSFSLSITVNNIGQETSSTWTDRVYLSADDQYDASDTLIRTFTNSPSLAAGGTRTYSNIATTIPPSAAPSAGQFYLILRTNLPESVNEGGRTTNNTAITTIQIDLPDLVAEGFSVPALVQAGITYPVSWTTRNTGTVATVSTNSRLYYSPDAAFGDANDVSLDTVTNTALGPNETQVHNTSFNISTVPARPDGTAYFYVRTDDSNSVYEGLPAGPGENNNTISSSAPFEYRVADLQVPAIGAPAEVETDTAFAMQWTTSNTGNKDAGNFSDRVYFSLDDQVGSDVLIGDFLLSGGLAAGTSVERIQNVTIPTSAVAASGNYWVYVRTDATTAINEGENENNNTRFQPVNVRRLLRPDLVVSNITAPPTAFFGQTIQVQWTVTNSGPGPTNASNWKDRVNLNTSGSTSSSSKLIDVDSVSALNPGESYVASATVKVPRGLNGTYMVVVSTDTSSNLNEEDTANNKLTVPITLNVPPLPDLTVSNIQAPAQAFAGGPLNVSWQVNNIGDAAAVDDNDANDNPWRWEDRIYLSRDQVLNTSQDRLIFTSGARTSPLAPGASFSRNTFVSSSAGGDYVSLPIDVSGEYYVFVVTDFRNTVYEFNAENNNSEYDQTQPGSPVNILVTPADLVILNAPTAPSAASGEQFIDVSFTVKNQGAFATGTAWTNALYLSADQTWDENDTYLGARTLSSLQPGSESLIEMSVGMPNCLNGSFYLIAVTDTENKVAEFDPGYDAETNNSSPVHAIAMTSPPIDLQASNVQHSPVTTPGQVVNVSWTTTNHGTGMSPTQWVDRILLTSTDGLGSTELGRITQTGSIASGQSVERNTNVNLPAFMQGQYVISIQTDYNRVITECGEGEDNNTASSDPFSVANNLPDLVADTVSAPGVPITAGDSFLVEWTGRNAGGTAIPANPGWVDTVYLSADASLSNSDWYLGSAAVTSGLAAGQTYQGQLNANIGNVPSGQYYFIVVTDGRTDVYEGPNNSTYETNNRRASAPFTVGSPDVDLHAVVNTVGVPTYSGTSAAVTWTVTNTGTTPTLGNTWSDYIILSRDAVLDSSDKTLGWMAREEVLAAGASYQQTKYVPIPSGLTGLYRIFVVADWKNRIVENNDSNNQSPAYDVVLELTPPADLQVTNIVVPAGQSPGESSLFRWTVQNSGSYPAIGPWRDSVYLSKDQYWDASDYLIGQRERTGPALAVSQSEELTAGIRIPMIEENDYYVIVRTDSQNRVRENNEANNVFTSGSQMPISVQTLTLNAPFATTLVNGGQKSFKFDTTANETVVVSLLGQPGNTNELFTNYLKAASRADYDYQSSGNRVPDQENFISNTEEGRYYSLVIHDYIQPESNLNIGKRSDRDVMPKAGATPIPPQNITVSANVLPFSIHSVSPENAGNKGVATIIIKGAKFQNGLTATLEKAGASPLIPLHLSNSSTVVVAVFDLSGVDPGQYDVVITNADHQVTRVEDGFEVVDGGGYSLTKSIISPSSIRAGQSRIRTTFSVKNTGLNDALYVPVIVSFPSTVNYVIDAEDMIDLPDDMLPPNANRADLVPHFDLNGRRYLMLVVPLLRSRTSADFGIDLSNLGFANFELRLAVLPSLLDIFAAGNDPSPQMLEAMRPLAPNLTTAECWVDFARQMLFLLTDLIPLSGCADEIISAHAAFISYISGIVMTHETSGGKSTGAGGMSLIQLAMNWLKNGLECGLGEQPWIKNLNFAWNLYNLSILLIECLDNEAKTFIGYVFAFDPNEKIGPKGHGTEGFIPIGKELLYRINFENLSSASAPAQKITITDELPPTLDPRTVRLKEIGFKQNEVVIPNNRAFHQARVQLGEDLGNLYADISAGLDIVNRRITWTISAIDPQTGEAPLDPEAGLLPPNNENHDGEGYVTFTIEPMTGFAHRTPINNGASIIFDDNEPIVTNITDNLLDSVVPSSSMPTLPATSADPGISFSWSGTDDSDGSGLDKCEIRVSTNGGSFIPFLGEPSLIGSGTFVGNWGKRYAFQSICSDLAGNVEAAPITPDAETLVLGGDTEGDIAPRPNGSDGQVDGSDLTQVRRFVAGLDTDYLYNEFQRVDVAPRAEAGNGGLTVADIVQARRYAAGLDARAEAGGPNAASSFTSNTVGGGKKMSATGLPRELRVVRLNRIGDKLYAAVEIGAQGDEVGAGFTLNFDPAVLSNPSNVQPGTGAGSAVVTVNSSQVDQGRIGITFDKAPNDPIPAGVRQLVSLEFDIAQNAPDSTLVSFGNGPVFDEVANGLAEPLQTAFAQSTITLLAPTAAGVSIAGRVIDRSRGISNAIVTLAGPDGKVLEAQTNTFGNFRFKGVTAGQTYVIAVRAKRYRFSPLMLNVDSDITGLEIEPNRAR